VLRPRTVAVLLLLVTLTCELLVARRAARAQTLDAHGDPLPLVLFLSSAPDRRHSVAGWVWKPCCRTFARHYSGPEAEQREAQFLAYAEAQARAHGQSGRLLEDCFYAAKTYLWSQRPPTAHIACCLAAFQDDEWLFVFVLYPFSGGRAPYPAQIAVNIHSLRPRLWD